MLYGDEQREKNPEEDEEKECQKVANLQQQQKKTFHMQSSLTAMHHPQKPDVRCVF